MNKKQCRASVADAAGGYKESSPWRPATLSSSARESPAARRRRRRPARASVVVCEVRVLHPHGRYRRRGHEVQGGGVDIDRALAARLTTSGGSSRQTTG